MGANDIIMQKMTSTLTCSRVADVNAVHPHVDVILHVTPLLIIIEDEASVSPQVKPVFFPPAQYGTLKSQCVMIKLKLDVFIQDLIPCYSISQV